MKNNQQYYFRHIFLSRFSKGLKCVFLHSQFIYVMNNSFSTFGRISIHIAFCIIIIVLFGRNTIIRMPVCSEMYKEYLTGFLVLALYYSNTYVLFPRLFLKGRLLIYLGTTIIALVIATSVELIMVYPQIKPALTIVFGSTDINRVLFSYWAMIFLRNSGFLLFSFALCNIRYQTLMKEKYETYIRKKNQEVDTHIIDNTEGFINVRDILYCQQAKNVTWICLEGGVIVTRYGSLKKTKQLIGDDLTIVVSKSLFVMQEKIQSFDEKTITIWDSIKQERHSFTWSVRFYDCAIQRLKTYLQKKDVFEDVENTDSKENKSISSYEWQNKKVTLLKQHRNARRVFSYIHRHPSCKANQIAAKLSISEGSLNRILAQLRKEGLIEYVGSKKTGGYHAIETPTA